MGIIMKNGVMYSGGNTEETGTLKDSIANEYSELKTYDIGDLCFKNNDLYVCLIPIVTPESWSASSWRKTTIGDLLSDLYKATRA